MIQFSCRCGHAFAEPDDAAGSTAQCPSCFLLNDVPALGELQNINSDGTYKLDDDRSPPKPAGLPELLHVYTKGKVDARGNPIDLRNDPDEVSSSSHDHGHRGAARKTRHRPRYDPETGELIEAIPLVVNDKTAPVNSRNIPFAKSAVNYASYGTLGVGGAAQTLIQLVRPLNLLVMFIVLVVHLVLAALTVMMALRIMIFAPFYLATLIALVVHYGNVIDEIALEDRDELPRLLRDMRVSEDVMRPLLAILATIGLCYGPAIVVMIWAAASAPAAVALGAALAIVGTMLMPSILLTLLTSGSLANLRPDRVVQVVFQSGGRYFGVVIMFLLSIVPYLWGVLGLTLIACDFAKVNLLPGLPAWTTSSPMVLALLCVGIFGMHYFSWALGLVYREGQAAFPWVGRFHVREAQPPVVRQKRRYVTPPSVEP